MQITICNLWHFFVGRLRKVVLILASVKVTGTWSAGCCANPAMRQTIAARHWSVSVANSLELAKGPIGEPEKIVELSCHNYSYPLVLHQLLRLYDLDVIMRRFSRSHKLPFSLLQNLLLMLCDRFNDPLSKLGSSTCKSNTLG